MKQKKYPDFLEKHWGPLLTAKGAGIALVFGIGVVSLIMLLDHLFGSPKGF